MKIALFVKESIEESDELSTLLISKINEYNFDFDQDNPDVVIVVGGDGTLLRAIHEYSSSLETISFVGIHQGSLGFACGYPIQDINQLFEDLANGSCSSVKLNLLKAVINDKEIFAVNEIRIESPFKTLVSDVYINDELFENFRGNGLVVSTSFGSSGYNKSLGGSVIPPSLNLMQLKEIAPITNRVYQSLGSSLVLTKEDQVRLCGQFDGCVIGYDHLTMSADNSNLITIYMSNVSTNILYKSDYSYYKQLKEAFIK